MLRLQAELVLDAGPRHYEGPFWDPHSDRLAWVDIGAGELHFFDPESGSDDHVSVGKPLGAAAPRQAGGYVLAVEDGFAVLDDRESAPRMIATVDNREGKLRMNDGKCDPAGRFWAGSMAYQADRGAGALYRLNADGSVTTVLREVSISNGLDWSPDQSVMYFIDSLSGGIDRFAWDAATGTPSARERLVEISNDTSSPAGLTVADGMTVDAEGYLWVAVYGAGEVRRFAPDGRLEGVVTVPETCPTSCAYGGPGLDVLYITTAPAPGPEPGGGGGIYACRPGVTGREASRYLGDA